MFDISSLYGQLQPGDTKLVTFSFLGHTDINTHVLALCEVEGGPTYEITLKGQASFVSYMLDTNVMDFGLQVTTHFHHNSNRIFSAVVCVNGKFHSVLFPIITVVWPCGWSRDHSEKHREGWLWFLYSNWRARTLCRATPAWSALHRPRQGEMFFMFQYTDDFSSIAYQICGIKYHGCVSYEGSPRAVCRNEAQCILPPRDPRSLSQDLSVASGLLWGRAHYCKRRGYFPSTMSGPA